MSTEEREDFAALLAQYGSVDRKRFNVGERVKAKVIHIGQDSVFCELSHAQEAFIAKAALLDKDGQLGVQIGDSIDAFVMRTDDGIELTRRLGRDQVDLEMLEEAQRAALPVQGKVTGVNKGGLEVAIGGARGFCPIGQADVEFVDDPQTFIGKTFDFVVREVREGGRNILLSRRALLERERREKAKQTLASLAEGQEVVGTVTRLQPFGAFVDLGGLDGLIPMSELAHGRVNDASEIVHVGDTVKVKVLKIEDDPKRAGEKRIGLSLKAATPDPFFAFAAAHQDGEVLAGKVVKLEPFGVFVELERGVQGLVHISELAARRIGHPREVVDVGDSVQARILGIDRERQRISLSLKDAANLSAAGGPAAKGPGLQVGSLVEGAVERIERYGVFVKLDAGPTALVPSAETGTPRGADLNRVLPVGTKMALTIIEIDDRGRLKASKTAREKAEERADMAAYLATERGGKKGFSTSFGDLLKKK